MRRFLVILRDMTIFAVAYVVPSVQREKWSQNQRQSFLFSSGISTVRRGTNVPSTRKTDISRDVIFHEGKYHVGMATPKKTAVLRLWGSPMGGDPLIPLPQPLPDQHVSLPADHIRQPEIQTSDSGNPVVVSLPSFSPARESFSSDSGSHLHLPIALRKGTRHVNPIQRFLSISPWLWWGFCIPCFYCCKFRHLLSIGPTIYVSVRGRENALYRSNPMRLLLSVTGGP